MIKSQAYCDICGVPVGDSDTDQNAFALHLFSYRRMDAAGSMDDEFITMHLCPGHMAGFVRTLAYKNSGITKKLVDYVEKEKRHY